MVKHKVPRDQREHNQPEECNRVFEQIAFILMNCNGLNLDGLTKHLVARLTPMDIAHPGFTGLKSYMRILKRYGCVRVKSYIYIWCGDKESFGRLMADRRKDPLPSTVRL
jgi:hypothetical protein